MAGGHRQAGGWREKTDAARRVQASGQAGTQIGTQLGRQPLLQSACWLRAECMPWLRGSNDSHSTTACLTATVLTVCLDAGEDVVVQEVLPQVLHVHLGRAHLHVDTDTARRQSVNADETEGRLG